MGTQTTETAERGDQAVNLEGKATSEQNAAPADTQQQTQDGVVQPSAESQEPKEGTPEWATKRFGELTAQREEAKRLADDARREADFYKNLALEKAGLTAQPAKTEPENKEPQGPPVLENFTDYTEYMKALADYQVTQALKQAQTQIQQANTQKDRQTKFKTAADEFKKTTPDFEAVILNPTFIQSNAVIEAIFHSNKGPQVAYYLAKNPDVTTRLNALTPFEVALEIGRLEERLTPPQPKVISQTPAPLKNLSGTNATQEKDLKTIAEKGSMADYAAARADALKWRGGKAR